MNRTEEVRQKIISEILDGKYSPGDKLPTERDMAVITKTSRITVRRAYEQLEKNGVIDRQPKLGTRVADSFKGNCREIETVGLITTLRDQFSRDFIEAVHEACLQKDALMTLAISETTSEQNSMALKLVAKGIRNLIVWGFDRSLDFQAFARIRALGVNIVFFDRVIPGDFADFVGLDNQDAMKTIFEHSSKNNIDNFIYADASGLNVDSNNGRLNAFIQRCEKGGFEYTKFLVPWEPNNKAKMSEAGRKFFKKHKCNKSTALVCVNDIVALSILEACPRNIQIYSIDGSPEAVNAGIMSYSQPIRKMAMAAVKALWKQHKTGEKWRAEKIIFKGKLLG
jgi:DNA-binding LacI/PurR family transcriptional regulator